MTNAEQAITFIKRLLHMYLIEGNFAALLPMFEEKFSWVSTQDTLIQCDRLDLPRLLDQQRPTWWQSPLIADDWYQCVSLGPKVWAIYGKLLIKDASLTVPMQFTMICHLDQAEFRLQHGHLAFALDPHQINRPILEEYSVKKISDLVNQVSLDTPAKEQSIEESLIRKNKALTLKNQRYKLVIAQANLITFDYLPEINRLILSEMAIEKFDLPKVIDDPLNTLITSKRIHPNSVETLKNLCLCIQSGASAAEDIIVMIDKNGHESTNTISLMMVFNDHNHEYSIAGFMRDISEKRTLQSENQFQKAMFSDKVFSYEANLSCDTIIRLNDAWLRSVDLPNFERFSEMIHYIAERVIHPDDAHTYLAFFEAQNLMALLATGQHQAMVEYRRLNFAGQYNWMENTLNIIQDELTRDVKIRCYSRNIDLEKKNQLKALEEQRFYETMFSTSVIAYEVNISQNLFVRGHENWSKLFKIQATNDYSEMIQVLSSQVIHPDNAAQFQQLFSRQRLLEAYHNGEREITYQYKRPDESGQMIWVACTMHLLENPETKDIKSYAYIQDINDEKLKELALIYKSEHDSLTDLLNKGTLELRVEQYLQSSEGQSASHAFLIFDLDHFKSINDHLGHVFGDAVLSQISKKAQELFREDDFLGRIGGDEFVILMKNIPNYKIVGNKAAEMCAVLRESYTQNGVSYPVTISIGIAIYPEHGTTYTQLYENSDTALYIAKNGGKDQFVFYDQSMFSSAVVSPKPFEVNSLLESKKFDSNISEYVFRILYDSPDKLTAITSVLELIGKYYNVSRAYVFENSMDNRFCHNTFEWCNTGIAPQKDILQNVPYDSLGDYQANFNEEGIFYLPDINSASDFTREILEPQEVVSMLQFTIHKNGIFTGFVGFDQCQRAEAPSKEDITALRNIANILGVFLTEMRTNMVNESTKNAALSIANALESYAYVIDKDSYTLLFINDKTRGISPETEVGAYCYQAFWERNSPCEACPMQGLSEEDLSKRCTMELHNNLLNVWTRATASWINWTEGQRACLVDCVDITEYK